MRHRARAIHCGVAGVAVLLMAVMGTGERLVAQAGKRVYISVDMEGISGVAGEDQVAPAPPSTAVRAS